MICSTSHNETVIDPDRPVLCKEIQIPYFPKPGEVVKTRNGHGFLNLLVTLVQDQQRVQGHQLKLVRGSTRWTTSKELLAIQDVCLSDSGYSITFRSMKLRGVKQRRR